MVFILSHFNPWLSSFFFDDGIFIVHRRTQGPECDTWELPGAAAARLSDCGSGSFCTTVFLDGGKDFMQKKKKRKKEEEEEEKEKEKERKKKKTCKRARLATRKRLNLCMAIV